VSLWAVALAARPLRAWKVGLIAAISAAFAAAFFTPGVDSFFSIDHRPSPEVALQSVGLAVAASAAMTAAARIIEHRRSRRELAALTA